MDTVKGSVGDLRVRRRSTDLRALIVAAAEHTFGQLGYKGATMAGIAERAGVTRSVLTRNFATKADLFAEVMTKPLLQFTDDWTRRWTGRLATEPTEPELVYEFVSDLYRNSQAHVAALRLLMFSNEHLEPAVQERVWRTINDGLVAVLEIAHREIGAHGYPTRHVEVTVRALISMVLGYVTLDQDLLHTSATDEEVITHLASLILYGLALDAPKLVK